MAAFQRLLLLSTVFLSFKGVRSQDVTTTSTNPNYREVASIKSTEPICLVDSVDEYSGDGGFSKSEATGELIREKSYNPDKLTSATDGRPNIFVDLLGGGDPPSSDDMANYASAIVAIAVPCILVAIFNLCNCICCVCCRTCCRVVAPHKCRACKCIPKTSHYTNEEQYLPVGVYGILGVILFGFAVAGVTNGVHKFNDSLIEGICLTDNTYLRFSQFLVNVKHPLNELNTDFSAAVASLKDAATIDPQLGKNVEDIGPAFAALKQAAATAKANIPATDASVRQGCEALWDSIATMATDAEKESTASAEELNTELENTQKDIDTSLLSGSTEATTALSTAKTTLEDMQKQLDDSLDPRAYGLLALAQDIKGQKDNSGFAAFGWVFLSLLFVTVSIFGVHECKHHVTLTQPPNDNPHMPLHVVRLNHKGSCFARLACFGWCCALFFGIFCGLFAAGKWIVSVRFFVGVCFWFFSTFFPFFLNLKSFSFVFSHVTNVGSDARRLCGVTWVAA